MTPLYPGCAEIVRASTWCCLEFKHLNQKITFNHDVHAYSKVRLTTTKSEDMYIEPISAIVMQFTINPKHIFYRGVSL